MCWKVRWGGQSFGVRGRGAAGRGLVVGTRRVRPACQEWLPSCEAGIPASLSPGALPASDFKALGLWNSEPCRWGMRPHTLEWKEVGPPPPPRSSVLDGDQAVARKPRSCAWGSRCPGHTSESKCRPRRLLSTNSTQKRLPEAEGQARERTPVPVPKDRPMAHFVPKWPPVPDRCVATGSEGSCRQGSRMLFFFLFLLCRASEHPAAQ